MLKSEKGYFLAETIIALTVVATIITIIYINSMNYYVKQKTELTKFNTTQGLYSIKEIKQYLKEDEASFKTQLNSNADGFIDIVEIKNLQSDQFINALDVKKIYFTKYNMNDFITNSSIAPSIKKELKTVNTTDNKCNYRYFVIYKDNTYASVGIGCSSD